MIYLSYLISSDAVDEPNSCYRTQCGANAECHQSHGMVTCVCRPGMFGNPYVGCRPECVVNCDCPTKQSCVNNRCLDPCRGACGVGAHCQPVNHMPVCYCPQDHTGDPFVTCYPYRPGKSSILCYYCFKSVLVTIVSIVYTVLI